MSADHPSQPSRLAGIRGDLHPARSRGRVRQAGAAVLRRQGLGGAAAPGRKAFRPGRFPFPLMHIDTGHNFDEVIAFRDARAAELGENLIVRSVEDSIKRGSVVLRGETDLAQRRAGRHAAGGHRGVRLRRLHRRRAPRRGKGPRQGAHLLLPRRLRPVGPQGPAAGALEPLQHARASAARTCGCSRSRTGPSWTCGSTSSASGWRCRRSTTATSARWCAATACWCR